MSQRGEDKRELAWSVKRAAIPLPAVQAGDIGLAHSKGIVGFLIRLVTRSKWNHAFVVIAATGQEAEQIVVIQAEAHGVEQTTLDKVAPGGRTWIVPCPEGADRDRVIREASALKGERYAFVVIASILVNRLPLIRLQVSKPGTLICSAVCALALFAAGWEKEWPDLYAVTPAELAIALTI